MSREMRVISRAGKTFHFATLWLERRVRFDAALAYEFCRSVDDIADGKPIRPDRDEYLTDIAEAVMRGDSRHELVRPIVPLMNRFPGIREPLAALVVACRDDTPTLEIRDERDLERYAHGVAGNVGLIMYPILGGASPQGRGCAADLGIAMQCTNIARDVFEDLERGRVYLPSVWLEGCELHKLREGDAGVEESVVRAVHKLLRFADQRYARGLSGLENLAPQNRFAIKVAARCYSAIGERVIRGGRLARERAVVPLSRKIVLACRMGLFPKQESWVTHVSA